MSCLAEIVEKAKSDCERFLTEAMVEQGYHCGTEDVRGSYSMLDDYIGLTFYAQVYNHQAEILMRNCLIDIYDPCDLEAMDEIRHRYIPMFTMMDQDCNPIGCHSLYTTFGGEKECLSMDVVDPSLICGDLDVNWIVSPISIIWDSDAEVDQVASIIKFKLDPSRKNSWVIWRASEKTPLIVHDPDHKGVITSGSQLFGDWTFGGKEVRQGNGEKSIKKQPYDHGFEALATLDKNNDGRLDGSELTDLALWFDRNQDGVSQGGEVVSMKTAGVTVLYLTPDRIDKAAGYITASLGYERQDKGKVVKGAAVDWYSASYASKEDALADWQAKKALTRAQSLFSRRSNDKESDVNNSQNDSLGGIWMWALTEDTEKGSGNMGVLSIFEDGERLFGYSVVETLVRSKVDDSKRSYTMSYPIVGKKDRDKNGKTIYNFAIINADRITKNRAVLSDDGRLLLGKSVVQSEEEAVEVDYEWRARRVMDVRSSAEIKKKTNN